MTVTLFKGMKPFSQLMFTAFVVLGSFIILEIMAGIIAIFVFGLNEVSSMMTGPDFSNPETVKMMKLFQVAQTIGLFIVPPFIVARLFSGETLSYLSLERRITLQPALLVTFLVIAVNPFINFLGSVNAEMHLPVWLEGVEEWMRSTEDAAEKLTKAFLKVENLSGLFFNLLMIAVLPAFGEELLFRGVFQKQLTRMTGNIHWGIWLSAALFSALHMQFYGFIPRLVLGGMFGYLLAWSGSLWLPILAHFINNAGAVIILWMIDTGKINSSVEEFGTIGGQWPYAIVSLLIAIAAVYSIKIAFRLPPETKNY